MQLLDGIKMAPAKKILCLSIFDLLGHQLLDDIPTKQIYENAGLSANSFYYHFQDKYHCASFLFRIILFQSMGGETSSPMRILEDMKQTPDQEYRTQLAEKWNDHWFDMISYTRKHARAQFLNILKSRAVGSPYYELKAVWEHNFQQTMAPSLPHKERHSGFLSEAMFSFFELYLIHFFLRLDYDFGEADVERFIRLRRDFYASYLEDLSS